MVKHRTPAPRKHPVTWVLVADGRSAKVYARTPVTRTVPGPNAAHAMELHMQELTPVRGMAWEAESAAAYETGRNATGMVFESVGHARHMSEPRIDAREEVKRHLMCGVAGRLNEARAKRKFQRLVLVAPAKMLGELRKHLDEQALKSVAAEVPKDLTHFDAPALAVHLEGIA